MDQPRPSARTTGARDRTQRDLDRFRRREPGGGFWRSLGLIGSVGWPIVLLGLAGAGVGRYLDSVLGAGVLLSFVSLCLGVALGMIVAYRTLKEPRS